MGKHIENQEEYDPIPMILGESGIANSNPAFSYTKPKICPTTLHFNLAID